jgi:GDP-L-fucose synthase
MKKILITGSGGVLGNSFKQNEFLKKNNKFKFVFSNSKICDLRNYKKTFNYLSKVNPDYIINLAASSGGIKFSQKNHASLLRNNILINLNILEVSRKLKIKKIILTLTNGMYSEKSKQPYKENDIHNGYPPKNNYGSSFAKRFIDPAIKAYREQYKMNIIGLILPNLYGPNDNFNLDDATMLSATIHKAYLAKQEGSKLVVWGDGTPKRDYVFAEDVREIYIWALKNYSKNKLINIGSGKNLPVKKIVNCICKNIGFNNKNIIFDKSKPKGVLNRRVSITYFRSLYKKKFTPLEVGIQKTCKWFLKNLKELNLKAKS